MAEKKRNLFDDGVFKPLAKIGQGKTMRLRLQMWRNCLQFGTKINDDFLNLDFPIDQFAVVEDWFEDLEKDAVNRNIAITLRRGKDNQQYGLLVFGVGEDRLYYIGCANTTQAKVKHIFTSNAKFNYSEDGQSVPDHVMSRRYFRGWLRNVRTILNKVWEENYKSPEELAYRPGGQGGQGQQGGQSYGGGYNGGQPQMDFDADIQF